jgi:hypothetical protein
MESLDPLPEVIGLPQAAVAMPFQLDRDRERCVFGVVEKLLGRALGDRGEAAQLVHECVHGRFQLVVGDAFRGDPPFQRLAARNALRAHHDVLRTGDADDLLQPGRSAGARNLPELLFGQCVPARLRDDAEVAGERNLESDAKAVAPVGGDHRLRAARRGGDVPGELGDVLGRCLQESPYVAAGGEVLSLGPQNDHAHPRILVERLEHTADLVALAHRDRVHRRAGEDHVGALAPGVDLDAEPVQVHQPRIDVVLMRTHGGAFLSDGDQVWC